MRISARISQLEARTGTHSPAERADQRKRLTDAVRVMIDSFNEVDRTLPATTLAGMPTLQRWAWSLRFDAVPIKLADLIRSGRIGHAHS